jgi:Flp pilus assembly protein TadD
MADSLREVEHLLDVGRAAEAVTAAGRAAAAFPGEPAPLRLLAAALVEVGRYDEAVAQARAAVAAAPDDVRALVVLATALHAAGRAPEALQAARDATRLAPSDPSVWNTVALAAPDGLERVQAAQRMVQLVPASSVAHNTLGVVLLPKDRAAARRCFEEALRLDPSSAVARSNLALTTLRGRPVAAASGFFAAARLDPRLEEARHNLDIAVTTVVDRGRVAVAALLYGCSLALGDYSGTRPVAAPENLGVVRGVWFAGLAVGAAFTVRVLSRFAVPLRGYFGRALRAGGATTFWGVVLALLAVAGSVSMFLPPGAGFDTRRGLLRVAAVVVIGAWVVEWRRRRER